jgi:hypothetical protein
MLFIDVFKLSRGLNMKRGDGGEGLELVECGRQQEAKGYFLVKQIKKEYN